MTSPKIVKLTDTADAIGALRNIYKLPSDVSVYTASHILDLSADYGKMIVTNSGSSNNVTIPADSAVSDPWPLWTSVPIFNAGTGLTTLVAGGGVTLSTGTAGLVSAGRYALFGIIKVAANQWVAFGNLAA